MDEFEFDDNKSQTNLEKHGIDFEAAQALWKDPYLLEIRAKTEGELRFLLIGMISEKHWSAVVTYREGRIRLISVRRSRTKEVELYES
ncbi:BrnT family toxin [Vreelandella piezotolerans]|jgi:uncharacterized DUF497 family protein|uniref:BrnT family toxin n=1 Tax=Vreelandella piezotolerans TaxID=2609667 RepID=UPI00378BF345